MKLSSKKVGFNEEIRVLSIPERSSNMTQVEKSQVYYSNKELRYFRAEGRAICKKIVQKAHHLSKASPSLSPERNANLILEKNPCLRGLEVLVCPTWKGNKKMVMQTFHSYHKQLKASGSSSPEERSCSCWHLFSAKSLVRNASTLDCT